MTIATLATDMTDRTERGPATVSYLNEARKALGEYARIRRELALVQADERINSAVRRVVWAVASAIGALIALSGAWFWIAWDLHEKGWRPWPLALLSILAFGSPAAACALIATGAEAHTPKEIRK